MVSDMVHRTRSGVPSNRLLYTKLWSTAQRLSGPPVPTGAQRDVAVAELRTIAGDHDELLVEAAGVMLGVHPDTSITHLLYRVPAVLLLEASGVAADAEAVQRWIEIGRERRARGMCAHHHR